MKIVFWASDKDREQVLAKAVLRGAKRQGFEVEQRMLCANPDVSGFDVGCMVGVKSASLFHAHRAAGILPVMMDKGYVRSRVPGARTWEYWRISVGAHHPTRTTLMRTKLPTERWADLGIDLAPWRTRGNHILIAGSSAKYHTFYGLPEPTLWTRQLVEEIRQHSDRPIIYRPKPSWTGAVPIEGTQFSGGGEAIGQALWGAHCMITHGSNTCFEAALMGVPSIILGNAVAAPISSASLNDIEYPLMGKRDQWLANLAWHQFTENEFRDGTAWEVLRPWIERGVANVRAE